MINIPFELLSQVLELLSLQLWDGWIQRDQAGDHIDVLLEAFEIVVQGQVIVQGDEMPDLFSEEGKGGSEVWGAKLLAYIAKLCLKGGSKTG